MSSKYIDSGAYATSGYTLSGVFQSITIGSGGSIGGAGLLGGDSQAYTIVNRGRITSDAVYGNAIYLHDGGMITNAVNGMIQGGSGIRFHTAPGEVVNAGTIDAVGVSGFGFYSLSGGSVSNTGTIEARGSDSIGVVLNAGTVTNTGTGVITGSTNGIYMAYGGVVTNGAGAKIVAETSYGIDFGRPLETATIVNAGTIAGGTLASGTLSGIFVYDGGSLTNSTGGLIRGNVVARVGKLTLVNQGGIAGDIVDGRPNNSSPPGAGTINNSGTVGGIYLGGGGTVTNTGTAAHIGGHGIAIAGGAGTVSNFGSIIAAGTESIAVSLAQGYVVNQSGALISGSSGIVFSAGTATVMNYGLIKSDNKDQPSGGTTTYKFGIYLGGGGNATNEQSGTIQTAGYYDFGIGLKTPGTIFNDGTITGVGGALLKDGGTVVNAAGARLARIVDPVGLATIDNAGSILGGTFNGIKLLTGGQITNSAGGVISGVTGIYFLGSGTVQNFGSIAGTGGTAVYFQSQHDTLIDEAGSIFSGRVVGDLGTLDLAGSVGRLTGLGTNFTGFALVDLSTHESWTIAGTSTIASGTTSTVLDDGALIAAGTATIAGTVSGTGSLVFQGLVTIANGADVTVAHLTQTNGELTISGGTISLGSHFLTLKYAADFTGGTIMGAGYLQTDAATGLASLTLDGGAIWQDYGTVSQNGTLVLGSAGNGYGKLVVETGGVFDLTGDGGIGIAAGGSANIVNAALFEKTAGTGISTITVGVDNTGTIMAGSGTLYLKASLNGSGTAQIGAAATLELGGSVASSATIAFAGSTAELLLTDITVFQAAIEGFDIGSSGDTIDVTSFGTGTRVTFAQPNSGETVATLQKGSSTVKLALFGQYSLSGFGDTMSASGTVIGYTPPAQDVALAKPHH